MGTLFVVIFSDIGTQLVRSLTIAVQIVKKYTNYNPEVIKYRPSVSKYTPRRRFAPPWGVFGHRGSIFDHFGIVFRRNFDRFRTAIVKLRPNFVPIFQKGMTYKVPMTFHIMIYTRNNINYIVQTYTTSLNTIFHQYCINKHMPHTQAEIHIIE